ncbi:hypothetical protein PV728_47990 [Streptomyces europaeiscabiei]|uniref:hypothetical protein n=1 Tax=Streptomyces europaeiscabiei TaxID=146819 RepID=UPI0029A48C96|nr:hypothetical protein [Streptomyces europaeiscabiei]MDX3637792.1 hypothetical protein [Streptomyces europaeiscabiei]MDX3655604.1 hypothetical protein [Streptomyces europaeiscabiei]
MTTNPNPDRDFDGCRRTCRQKGAHTRVWGECEHGVKPEPTVRLSRVYTDTDGFPSIGFDSYTVAQLGELITAGLRASDLPVNGDDLVDVGLVAAHAIFNRNTAAPAAAVPVAAPPTTEQTALRERVAEALLDHLSRTADIRPGRDGDLAFMPEVTDAERMRLADAVLAVLPAPADRAATLREAAARYEEILANADTGQDPRYWTAVRDITLGLRAMAAEAPHAETPDEAPLLCPRCGTDISDYGENDFVFRTGDERPYCSGECVVAAHRAALKTAPAVVAQPGKETQT